MNSDFIGKTFRTQQGRCDQLSKFILRHVARNDNLQILDIGCGSGELLFDLANKMPNASFMGVDISEANIIIANGKKRKTRFGNRLTFISSDYMKFSPKPFDVIISDSVLQNMEVPKDVLFSRISSDLKSGALLLVNIPYNCLYNQLLWNVRRFLRIFRGARMDKIILNIAKIVHGRKHADEILLERVCYMYLVPYFYYSESLCKFIENNLGLQFVTEQKSNHESFAQPKHKILVFRKR